ncbi:class I SAM-dependent methyltransferase [Aquihabitans sp. G128]|uniref:class I SAM-dependent methyltransferase n=1 Tax=Aquihabitans sp. G128 TaxID=2849779 RepID=UPI001C24F854|nr:class I SAM-dependent methyltransferase [Aquihabitans sp. G128]QXC61490.1 class I SAM-dependent methyltransferase [Aquihabitans sp. G128]
MALDRPGRPADVRRAIEAALPQLHAQGWCRIDVRVAAAGPLGAAFGAPWFGGTIGPDQVWSWALRHPWLAPARGSLDSVRTHLPGSRTARRLAGISPAVLPRTVATLAEDRYWLVRERRRSAPAATRAVIAAAPPGTVHHAESRYRTIRQALALVPADARAGTVLDVGSGSGRVLEVARRLGFATLSGIEHDPDLVASSRHRLGRAATIVQGDALAEPIDPAVATLFLNNPLQPEVLDRFAALLRRSLDQRDRPLVLLYLNAPTLDPFLAIGLRVVHAGPLFAALVHDPAPAP